MDINNLLVGGFSVGLLTLILVQVCKESGLPSRHLPLTSILVAGVLLALGSLAPETVSQIVGGAIAVGGATTMGVRAVKTTLDTPDEAEPVATAVSEETNATLPSSAGNNQE